MSTGKMHPWPGRREWRPRRKPGPQLVKTARQLFFDDGYRPTSLEKVADRRRLLQGRGVFELSATKDELCTAVLDEVRCRTGSARFLDIVAKNRTCPARIDAIRDWATTRLSAIQGGRL